MLKLNPTFKLALNLVNQQLALPSPVHCSPSRLVDRWNAQPR